MNILALDPGKVVGWAYDDEKGVHSGSMTFDQIDHGERLWRFRLWLGGLVVFYPALVVWDKSLPFGRKTDESDVQLAMSKYIEEACWDNGIKRLIVPMNSVKKRVVGNGRATKSEVLKWAKWRGFNPANIHEADALALLEHGMAQ